MPSSQADLVSQLLALNAPDQPFIVTASGNEVAAAWNIVDANWLEFFSKAGMKKNYKMVLTLDATRNTAKMVEYTSDVSWSAGTPSTAMSGNWTTGTVLVGVHKGVGYGIKPDMSLGQTYTYDFDVNRVKGPVVQVLQAAGWKTTKGNMSKGALISVAFVAVLLILIGLLSMSGKLKFHNNMQVNPPDTSGSQTSQNNGIAIPMIEIGQVLTRDHQITNPSTTINDPYGKVYVKAYIVGASVGDTIQPQITYLKTGQVTKQKLMTITNAMTSDAIANYAQPTGWKPGDYQVDFIASNGLTKSATFTVPDTGLYPSNTPSPMPQSQGDQTMTNSPQTITDVTMSQSLGPNDQPSPSSSFFHNQLGNIYVRANLIGGKVGDLVQAQLTDITTSQSGSQKSFTLDSTASNYLLITYSAPANGWLNGSYKIDLITLDGHKKTTYFDMGQ